MAVLFVIFVVVSTFAAAVVYLILLTQSLATRIWWPGAVGIATYAVSVSLTYNLPLPAPVRTVQLPLIMAAAATCLSVRSKHWKIIAKAELISNIPQTIVIVLCCAVGAVLGVLTGLGKPVLIALNQDVIGVMASEKREIAVAGGLVAGVIGAVIGTILASVFAAPKPNDS